MEELKFVDIRFNNLPDNSSKVEVLTKNGKYHRCKWDTFQAHFVKKSGKIITVEEVELWRKIKSHVSAAVSVLIDESTLPPCSEEVILLFQCNKGSWHSGFYCPSLNSFYSYGFGFIKNYNVWKWGALKILPK